MIQIIRLIFKRTGILFVFLMLAACSPSTSSLPSTGTVLDGLYSPPNMEGFLPVAPAAVLPGTSSSYGNLVPQKAGAPQAPLSVQPTSMTGTLPALDAFVAALRNDNASQVVGVFVENGFALPVVQQPANKPNFVSTHGGDITQFSLVSRFSGNIGLLAHNYLSGKLFLNLRPGDNVRIIYGDGRVVEYVIDRVETFQALKPDSPSSDFLDLTSGETMTASTLFYREYGGDPHVTFQTCINRENNSEWGRLFIIANPAG